MPMPKEAKLEEGRKVIYGIRPEHLEIDKAGAPARVSVVEPTGSETLVFAKTGEADIVALFRERHDFNPRDEMVLKPRVDRIHLFDAETGARV